jgi:hypothetical protein
MTDRRYSDDEVAEIFRKASESSSQAVPGATRSEGLTLAELKDIGREVGIAPEAVALAARSMDIGAPARSTRLLGLPLAVERTVELDRPMSDAEWERLVVELRQVFKASGRMSSSGSFRQWSNGNLQALLEPAAGGHRVRMRTLNGSARTSIGTGLAFVGVSLAIGIAGAFGGHLGASLPGVALFFAMGAGLLASAAVRLPGWARLRGRQMDEIAEGLVLPSGSAQDPS